jgi:hypothetical protein
MDLFREKDYEVVQVDPSTPAAKVVSMATEQPKSGTNGYAVVTGPEFLASKSFKNFRNCLKLNRKAP